MDFPIGSAEAGGLPMTLVTPEIAECFPLDFCKEQRQFVMDQSTHQEQLSSY